MPSILALDQGTTGSTALLIHQDGSVLARGYREFTQHYPRPGWVEHDPEEIVRVSLEAMREALAGAGERPAGIGITNQRETIVLWDRRTLAPVGRAIVWQDRRTSERCRELRETGAESLLRERTGLVADPYFSATKLEWLLRDPDVRRRAGRGELAAGTVESWLVARLTGGRVHVTDHTNASRTLLYNLAARAWDPELLELFGVPQEMLPSIVASSGTVAEIDAEHLGSSLPIAGLAGDQQAALFGQGCCRDGLAKNTYGTGAFLLVFTGDRLPVPAPGVLATAACGPRGEPAYALEGSIFIAGAAVQWLRDGLGLIQTAGETEALARSVSDTGGVHFVPGVRGARDAPLGGRRARDDHRPHARHHPRASRSRGARVDGIQQRRAAPGDGGCRRLRCARAPGRRGRVRQRLADAVPGRRHRHPGRAAGHGRDDGARRRGSGRTGAGGVAEQRRISRRTALPAVRAGHDAGRAADAGAGVGAGRGRGARLGAGRRRPTGVLNNPGRERSFPGRVPVHANKGRP